MKKIKKDVKLKIVIDYFWAHHCMHRGLIAEDHMRISSDLEKITKIPLLGKADKIGIGHSENMRFNSVEKSYFAELPVRYVRIICDAAEDERRRLPEKILKGIKKDDFPTGRLLGYELKDEVHSICGYLLPGKKKYKEIHEWYSDPNKSETPCKPLGEKVISLHELDKLKF